MRKPYMQPQQAGWWMKNPAFRGYMLREATALPLFGYTLLIIVGVYRLSQGEAAFSQWLEMLRAPWCVALHAVALAAALLHAWTWLELVPRILVVHTARFRVPGQLIKHLHQTGAMGSCLVILALGWFFLGRAGG